MLPVLLRLVRLLALCLAASLSQARAADLIWIEAESFADPGGWTSDTQFIEQMGSPYLLATDLGKPVADAVTSVPVPLPGRYRLWARTRDWEPGHHPGRFQILINGRPAEPVLGQSGRPGWQWEDAGLHDLAGAAVELRLHDLTGFYGRCDALVLAADPAWQPPQTREALAQARLDHGALSPQVRTLGHYDVVVVGGGLAGCTAAVSSARLGARTVLLQNRPVLGGNASVEILVPPVGIWPHSGVHPLDPRETGVLEEFRTAGNQRTAEAKLYSGRLKQFVSEEPNLDVFLETHISGVEMSSPTAIQAVTGVNVRTGERVRASGTLFLDCTGESVVGVAAGAEYRHGREARALYQEDLAPEQGDGLTMGNSLKYVSLPTGQPQRFEQQPWAMAFPRCEDFVAGRHPRLGTDIEWQWMLELGGTRDTFSQAEEIRDDLFRLIFGLWDHVKNHCPKLQEQAADHELAWVGHVAGKRENRRLIGDYVLNQNDIVQQTLLPDRIAYCAWGIDDHYPEGFLHQGKPAQHGYHGVQHSVPYRSLYSRNIDNLMMAGRNISASHVAMAATRVMLTCAIVGQATGTAAALCVRHGATPRTIYQQHLEELQQQLLKDGAYLIDLPNRDPRDLARTATVLASSARRRDQGELMAAAQVTDGFARFHDGQTSAWAPGPAQPLPQWLELRWAQPQTCNTFHLSFLTKDHAASAFALEAGCDDSWKPLAAVAGNTERRLVLAFDRVTTSRLRLVWREGRSKEAGVCEIRVYDEPAGVVETARRVAAKRNLPQESPALPWNDQVRVCSGRDPAKLPGLVLDDTQGEPAGHWVVSQHSRPYVADGYAHDGNQDKGGKSLRFYPHLPQAGQYEIRLAYNAQPNRASNVPVSIITRSSSATVHVNQRQPPPIDGLFASLGVYTLEAGPSVSVVIGNEMTDGYTVVDAIQLLPAAK